MQVRDNVPLKRQESKGLRVRFSGEIGMILSWTISIDGRVLRGNIQGMLGQEERLTGNSSLMLAVAWEMKTQSSSLDFNQYVYRMKL